MSDSPEVVARRRARRAAESALAAHIKAQELHRDAAELHTRLGDDAAAAKEQAAAEREAAREIEARELLATFDDVPPGSVELENPRHD